LLGDVEWCFTRPGFRSRARFEGAVRDLYREMGWEFDWRPDEVVLRCPRVRVRPDFWDDYEPEEAPRFVVELTADHAAGFTAGELLFKVHNAFLRWWEEEAGDHTFFEGFHLAEAPAGDAPPLYDICLGS
jgi:hypothetical protein